MTDVAVVGTFTKTVAKPGTPAEGLTLAEFDFHLTRRTKADGTLAVIWDGTAHPATAEIPNIGQYLRVYSGADLQLYDYMATIQYTGATSLDSNNATGVIGAITITLRAGSSEVTDITIESPAGTPREGAAVWITTDAAGTHIVWTGTSNTLGKPKDLNDANPWLDPGDYYVWTQLAGHTFPNPTAHEVT